MNPRLRFSPAVALLSVVTAGLGVWGAILSSRQDRLQDQLTAARRQVEQLLADVEAGTRARLAAEAQTAALEAEREQLSRALRSQEAALAEAVQRIDPDLETLEADLRQRITAEVRRQQAAPAPPLSTTTTLIRELGSLSQDERLAVIQVQAQFGEFLDALNVDARRQEQITQALMDHFQEQQRARQDLLAQRLDPRETRQQLMALSSPETAQAALEPLLTADEMTAFQAFQAQQPQVFIGAGGRTGDVFMLQGERRRADGRVQTDLVPVPLPGAGGVRTP